MAKSTGLSSTINLGKKKQLLTKKKINVEKVDTIATNMQTEKKVRLSIDVPESLYKAMKIKVATEGKTVRGYFLELLRNDINE